MKGKRVWVIMLITLSAFSTGFIINSMLDDPVASPSMLVTTRKDDAVQLSKALSRYREAVINMDDQQLDDLLDAEYFDVSSGKRTQRSAMRDLIRNKRKDRKTLTGTTDRSFEVSSSDEVYANALKQIQFNEDKVIDVEFVETALGADSSVVKCVFREFDTKSSKVREAPVKLMMKKRNEKWQLTRSEKKGEFFE